MNRPSAGFALALSLVMAFAMPSSLLAAQGESLQTAAASASAQRFQLDTDLVLDRTPMPQIATREAARIEPPASTTPSPLPAHLDDVIAAQSAPLLKLGPGDAVTIHVFGRPEFDTTAYVDRDQTLNVPLAGRVKVGGLSPSDAGAEIAKALVEGEFLVNPQVSLELEQFRSQQISVLGEVRAPGRFALEAQTSVLDVLAQAGGVNTAGADLIYLMRRTADGRVQHIPVNLRELVGDRAISTAVALQGGDTVYVPRADQFYVYGEVQSPNMYRLEPGTTVVQAIARSGGLTPRGSDNRIEIRRKQDNGDYRSFTADLSEVVRPDDVIRVKERIF